MPKVSEEAQAGFEDKPLNDPDLGEACERYLEHKEAASEYARANRDIKERLPAVEVPTRFLVNESYVVEVTPQSRDGYDVNPTTVQRKSVKAAGE